jgi:hypothetical protein
MPLRTCLEIERLMGSAIKVSNVVGIKVAIAAI